MADIGASNWNESDSGNSTAAPDGAPEGMAPSGVDDTMRAMMGAIKRWYDWSIPKLTGGTSTAYTLTYAVAPGALVDGMTHLVRFNAANGVGATLNVNNLGAKPIYAYSVGIWYQAPPGLVDVDTVVPVTYDATSGGYRLIGLSKDATGAVVPFAGATAPAGYLLCFGQAVSRTAYPGLFAVCGTTYGAGDGSTTFNLPDLRGTAVAGLDNMGGGNANRLSSVMASTTRGAAGGQQTESASVSGSASVSVGVTVSGSLSGGADPSVAEVAAAASGTGASFVGHSHTVTVSGSMTGSGGGSGSISGSTSAVTNVQPTMVLNQMIAI
jgi:microcystin-dependent protein